MQKSIALFTLRSWRKCLIIWPWNMTQKTQKSCATSYAVINYRLCIQALKKYNWQRLILLWGRCWCISRLNNIWWHKYGNAFLGVKIIFLVFSRAVLCSLTGNILGLKSHGGWRADDVQTMCRWHADDVRMTREWDFVGDFSWRMTYVIRTSSTCRLHVVCSTPHGQRRPKLSFYYDRNWLLTGICRKNVELFHFRII